MIQILRADARAIPLADASVDCVVTSPPYWALRNYQVDGQIGLEKLHDCLGWARGSECAECHVCTLRRVFREVHRVLKPTGTLWMNYGDCYATGAGKVRTSPGGGKQGRAAREKYWGKHAAIGLPPMTQPNRLPLPGLKPKDLCGMAWRLAFALQADGWWLRSDIVWCKPNPMPESVTDRPTRAHEYLFLLTKSERYHFDQAAWREPASPGTHARHGRTSAFVVDKVPRGRKPNVSGWMQGPGAHDVLKHASPKPHNPPGQWDMGAGGHSVLAHNAPMPRDEGRSKQKLRLSSKFGHTPGFRKRAAEGSGIKNNGSMDAALAIMPSERNRRTVWTLNSDRTSEAHFATFPEALVEPCILAGCPKGGTVLDPFSGTGTTLAVANRLGRGGIGLELSAEYIEIARRRIFSDVTPTRGELVNGQRLIFREVA